MLYKYISWHTKFFLNDNTNGIIHTKTDDISILCYIKSFPLFHGADNETEQNR